ncbi:arsenate reductase ArsC [Limosilactobacillus fermentum]|uniref:arsenate reductase ArsC n=1 Tax=Limosilactobacillus fermentum TaxID=1613 RepID=UPI0021A50B58|nr:arsenate reductase ArsC [Limosilactobacillus fermentum]MCT2871931.1 arsenate reductase ArsC [Limosilactobacillus fermentum]
MTKPKVAFICTHNSCRSQIAEALGRHLASDVFDSYSAGTAPKRTINPDAVRLVKERYGQHNKALTDLPQVDVVITMGCGVQCPSLPAQMRQDWGLDDPTGLGDDKFNKYWPEIP